MLQLPPFRYVSNSAAVNAGLPLLAGLDLNFTTMSSLDPRITFTRAAGTGTAGATYFNSSGVLSTAGTNVPRLDYDPVTHAPLGLLMEGASAINTVWSQDYTQVSWTKTGTTVAANQIAAPDGTTTGNRLTASATTSTVSYSTSTGNAQPYVQSFFAKKGTTDWIYTTIQSTSDAVGTPRAWFNLATGIVGTVESPITAAAIRDVGNGWYRCYVTRVGTTGTARIFAVGPCDADGSNAVTVGKTVHLWGTQLETNSIAPTSYVAALTGALPTRPIEVALMTATNFSSWYNQPAGTFIAEFDLVAAIGTRGVLAADNASTAETIQLYGSGTDPKATIRDNNVPQADLDLGTLTTNTTYKSGVSYTLNRVAGCFDGGTVVTDLAATIPTPTQLRIGAESATVTNVLNGHIRRVQFFATAVDDSTLAALTAPAGGMRRAP